MVVLLAMGSPPELLAQARARDLSQATLEDLLNIEITSASRKEQRADAVPAAVHVITQDDIRRSGITTLPELFRLVPGMEVAQINSNDWAISVRGFNGLWANQLLVLIDGRSVYTRSFSGVFWSAQDLLLEDIDRIEVVRGPGGSIWGANAVNGVVNIVTKTAADTKGALVRLGDGSYEGTQTAVRYGGSFGNTAYRVFSQWSDHNSSLSDPHTAADDRWRRFTNGFRIDWARNTNAVMTEGSFVGGGGRPLWTSFTGPTPSLSFAAPYQDATIKSGNMLARWIHSGRNGTVLQIQSFVDIHSRDDGNGVTDREHVFDLDLQFHTKLAERHDLVIGGGYRDANGSFDGKFGVSADPPTSENAVMSAFAQDDVALTDHLQLTLGAKLEHDSVTAWGVQPTIRLMANIAPHQHLWAAASRALRTPSALDRSLRFNYAAFIGGSGIPIVLGATGNPNYQTEQFLDAEGGYRVDFGSSASADVTVFRGRYSGLATSEPTAPVFETTPGPPHLFIGTRFENLLNVNTSGVEVAGHWMPTGAWRLDGSYSGLRLVAHPDAESHDPAAPLNDGNAPAHQWQLHSSARLGPRLQLDAGLFHVGRLRTLNVPAYTRADTRIEIKVSKPLSVIAIGQNLFDRAHPEFANANTGQTATLVPRSVNLKLLWRF